MGLSCLKHLAAVPFDINYTQNPKVVCRCDTFYRRQCLDFGRDMGLVGLIKFEDNTVLDTYAEGGIITAVVWPIWIPSSC